MPHKNITTPHPKMFYEPPAHSRPMNSALSICPFVMQCSQDWLITFFNILHEVRVKHMKVIILLKKILIMP